MHLCKYMHTVSILAMSCMYGRCILLYSIAFLLCADGNIGDTWCWISAGPPRAVLPPSSPPTPPTVPSPPAPAAAAANDDAGAAVSSRERGAEVPLNLSRVSRATSHALWNRTFIHTSNCACLYTHAYIHIRGHMPTLSARCSAWQGNEASKCTTGRL